MNRFTQLILALALLTSIGAMAQTQTPGKLLTGYTYEVKPSLAGKRVFICTQQPVDEKGNLVGKGDLTAQTQQVFKNIGTELAKKGLSLKDIKQVSYRMKGYTASSNALLSAANAPFSELHPGITDYQNVASFFRDDMLLEIEVVAVK